MTKPTPSRFVFRPSRLIPHRGSSLEVLENDGRVLDPLLRLLLRSTVLERTDVETAGLSSLRRLVLSADSICGVVGEFQDDRSLRLTMVVLMQEAPAGSEAAHLETDLTGELLPASEGADESRVAAWLGRRVGVPAASVRTAELRADARHLGVVALASTREAGVASSVRQRVLENFSSCLARALLATRTLEEGEQPYVDEVSAAYFQARLHRKEFIRITSETALDPELLKALGSERMIRLGAVPTRLDSDESVVFAVVNPTDHTVRDELEVSLGRPCRIEQVTTKGDVHRAAERLREISYHEGIRVSIESEAAAEGEAADVEELESVSEMSPPIMRLANAIVEGAVLQGASDIHVEPQEKELVLRYRIDGTCEIVDQFPRSAIAPLVNRFKIMAGLDISEHRIPQDGRIVFRRFSPATDVDLRVSVVPMNYGESLVMRVINRSASTLPLEKLGFSEAGLKTYRQWISAPYGMILHVGPTGSGKSMSLYSALNVLNSPRIKIVTAEDPIEYTLPGINQCEVRVNVGLTFAAALRAFLRQDPDVILVGEIRDRVTAETAIEASLTGHLLLSTLHANDALAVMPRLTELGVEPYLVANSLLGVCAQRLMRRVCTCATSEAPTEFELAELSGRGLEAPAQVKHTSSGCERCRFTGFKGRVGIYEVLGCTGPVRDLVAADARREQYQSALDEVDFQSLYDEALRNVLVGTTTLAEAMRVARDS